MANQNDDMKRGGASNFANDREKASAAGKKGGQHSPQHSQSGGQHTQQGGQAGRSQSGGNFADDRQKASEAGKKGGSH